MFVKPSVLALRRVANSTSGVRTNCVRIERKASPNGEPACSFAVATDARALVATSWKDTQTEHRDDFRCNLPLDTCKQAEEECRGSNNPVLLEECPTDGKLKLHRTGFYSPQSNSYPDWRYVLQRQIVSEGAVHVKVDGKLLLSVLQTVLKQGIGPNHEITISVNSHEKAVVLSSQNERPTVGMVMPLCESIESPACSLADFGIE